MLITEIFASIQGEGQRAGLPTTFVRLARCPYRCTWCDSVHTFTGGDPMSLDEVIGRVRARLLHNPAGVFFQPAWGRLEPADLVAWLRADPVAGVRLSLQLHKFIWGPETLGV